MEDQTDQASSAEGGIPEYYTALDSKQISQAIGNLDDPSDYEGFEQCFGNPSSQNFVVDFGDDEAWCAFNLEAEAYSKLLTSDRPHDLNARWINIWLPYKQKDILHTIAKHYEFSPRLLGLMCSDPVRSLKKAQSVEESISSIFGLQRTPNMSHHSSEKHSKDSEETIGMSELKNQPEVEMLSHMSHYRIADEVWHWSSVDWGRRFVCLGYNTLYNLRTVGDKGINPTADLPNGKRVWSWLILTEDKTIISINEDPYPFSHGHFSPEEIRGINVIRRRQLNVFRQLSKVNIPTEANAMTVLPIRHRLGNTEVETVHRPSDSPGLLFYYLFEDYHNTYTLVARQEHQYAAELDNLRKEMLLKAKLTHVDRLHHIGRQLAVLKRIYQSYEVLIDRVLEKQEPTLASLKNSHIVSGTASLLNSSHHSHVHMPEAESLLGVSLSSAARVRFERLKYRIRLYAISEIQECLDQKDSLVMMNFNLIAIKESYSVERLTRVTLLFAKVTMVFMPVSLMTAYFSIQIDDTPFTIKSYWTAFAIILPLSIALVLLFSFASGTMEGRMVYRPLSRIIFDLSKGWVVRRRKNTHE